MRGCAGGRSLDPRRVAGHAKRQGVDRVGHRRREEERLRALAQALHHGLDLGAEAHVQHPVGFVEDEVADALQAGLAPVLQVDQASGCGHDDLVAPLQGVQLGSVGHAAADYRGPEARTPREGNGVIRHLLGELPGGTEHQHLKSRAGFQRFERRKHECPGLARPRPGYPHHVPSGHDQWDGLLLNGGRRGPTQCLQQRPA